MLQASAETSIAALPSIATPVTIAVGPEGGLEAGEVAALTAAHFLPVRLGGNILRFETAAIAALAIIRSLLDVPITLPHDVADLSVLQNR